MYTKYSYLFLTGCAEVHTYMHKQPITYEYRQTDGRYRYTFLNSSSIGRNEATGKK